MMSSCPDRQVLHQLAEGRLGEAEALAIEEHVENCRPCARILARFETCVDIIEQVRDLHTAREKIKGAMTTLSDTEKRITTSLFGKRSL